MEENVNEAILKPLEEMTAAELMEEAKTLGIPKFGKMKKPQLVAVLTEARETGESGPLPEAPVSGESSEEGAEGSTPFVCEVEGCGEAFANSFELSQHMAAEHPVSLDSPSTTIVEEELPPVVIKTVRPIEVSVMGVSGMVRGSEIEVPYNQAGDIKRRLIEAYGADILAE